MGTIYFKRLRLELELGGSQFPQPVLPAGFEWLPWAPGLLMRHAVTKHESFRAELDARIFPCFREAAGCLDLMSEIAQRATFVPAATWLVSCRFPDGTTEDCATIQGIVQSGGWGAIQNVGVVPEYRGRGLGRALLLQCLAGFQRVGVPRVYLEVTASNLPAVQLYRSLGFCLARTTYRGVEEEPSSSMDERRVSQEIA
jgi:ribosomal protein S18 acetylase RimI-like enzyme